MVVDLYGILYLEVARAPEQGWLIAAVGLAGKLLGPLGFAIVHVTGVWPHRPRSSSSSRTTCSGGCRLVSISTTPGRNSGIRLIYRVACSRALTESKRTSRKERERERQREDRVRSDPRSEARTLIDYEIPLSTVLRVASCIGRSKSRRALDSCVSLHSSLRCGAYIDLLVEYTAFQSHPRS